MNFFLLIISILLISYINSLLAKRFKYSEVIGLIILGLVFAPILKGGILLNYEKTFNNIAMMGLFSLMFLAGFEVSWNKIVTEKKDAIIVTIFTVISSLILGTSVFLLLDFSLEASLIMGLCFGVTAEATKARILMQLGKIKTKIGSLLMGAGIINDIFGVIILAILTYVFTNKISWHELIILLGTITAFMSGVLVHYAFDRYSKKIKILEQIILYLIVPFFFVNIGFHFNPESFKTNIVVLPVVLLVSTAGQMIGSMLSGTVIGITHKQAYLIGWGMNSKGAVELGIALVALEIGLLPSVLYSSLVVTTLVVSVLFQVIIFKMVKKDPGIMEY